MEQGLFYNNVTFIDFAYLDRKYEVHGESYCVDVELVGGLDDEAMILDFSFAKQKIKEIIDSECDHKIVVTEHLVEMQGNVGTINKQALFYRAPAQAFCLVPFENVTEKNLSCYLEKLIKEKMPENVSGVRIALHKDERDHASFQYTHGLKQHRGNCQRLIHGHRSAIEIFVDGVRDQDLEKKYIDTFLRPSMHFAYADNVKSSFSKNGFQTEIPMVHIKYTSSQGDFELKIPGVQVLIIDEETTIENIAKYLCNRVFEIVDKKCTITFKVFEGIGKGGKVTLSSPL